MTIELTNEQIVTNLLISNEMLKAKTTSLDLLQDSNLGDYLGQLQNINSVVSKYSFIDMDNCWSF